jgi:hypothetical protein
VLAFEHTTLTQIPIENALQLAAYLQNLSPGMRLHLVTQSRGRLLGELICRACAVKQARTDGSAKNPLKSPPFSAKEHQLFERDKKKYAGQAELLRHVQGHRRFLSARDQAIHRNPPPFPDSRP